MLTAEKLDAMSPEDRTQLWRGMCVALHGNSSYRAEIARRLGIVPQTIFRWERENNTPHMALMLIEFWLRRSQLGELKTAAETVQKWADSLS